jgi:hypothetical protein
LFNHPGLVPAMIRSEVETQPFKAEIVAAIGQDPDGLYAQMRRVQSDQAPTRRRRCCTGICRGQHLLPPRRHLWFHRLAVECVGPVGARRRLLPDHLDARRRPPGPRARAPRALPRPACGHRRGCARTRRRVGGVPGVRGVVPVRRLAHHARRELRLVDQRREPHPTRHRLPGPRYAIAVADLGS